MNKTTKNTFINYNYSLCPILAKGYKTLAAYNENIKEGVGQTKHYPPAIREWSNSIYSFNKNEVKDLVSKEKVVNNIVKSYFDLDRNLAKLDEKSKGLKSKRMRNLLKRTTTTKLFASKPLIKQTNDKTIVTLFLFDKLKSKSNKKLFYLKKDLNNITGNTFTGTSNAKEVRSHITRKTVYRHKVNNYSYSNLLTLSLLKKKQGLKTLFVYYFLKLSLSLFKIEVDLLRKGDMLIQNNATRVVNNNLFVIYTVKSDNTSLLKSENGKSIKLDSQEYYKTLSFVNNITIKNLNVTNEILYKYLYITISKLFTDKDISSKGLKRESKLIKSRISDLFDKFNHNYYMYFSINFLKKECLSLVHLYKLYLTKSKLDNLMPALKYLLFKLYSKKIELNVINLKYLHLNSDIFTSAISIKLKGKTSRLLRILKKSLKLVKVPQIIQANNNYDDNNRFVKPIGLNRMYKGINVNNWDALTNRNTYLETSSSTVKNMRDRLTNVLQDMFSNYFYKNSNALINSDDNSSSYKDILTSVKYKWITGVRLEAKGRLTKRFTAARSSFKMRYKGNLKNLDFLTRSVDSLYRDEKLGKNLNTTSNLYMIRNTTKPNIQYTVSSSKRRIGSFGIKGWVNSN